VLAGYYTVKDGAVKILLFANFLHGQERGAKLFEDCIFKHVIRNIIPKFSVESGRAKMLISIFFNYFT
jgi:hypothetical protein